MGSALSIPAGVDSDLRGQGSGRRKTYRGRPRIGTGRGLVANHPVLDAVRWSAIYVISAFLILFALVFTPAFLMELVDDGLVFYGAILSFFPMLILSGLIDLTRTDQSLKYSKRGPRENRATKVALVAIGVWSIFFIVAMLML